MKLLMQAVLPVPPRPAGLIRRLGNGKLGVGRDAARRALGSHPVAGDGDFPSGSERRSGLKTPDRGSRESGSGWPGSDARLGWVVAAASIARSGLSSC